jgi:GcrA cell cycle regulator
MKPYDPSSDLPFRTVIETRELDQQARLDAAEPHLIARSASGVWDDATIEALRQLWAEGVSAKDIGYRLSFSKNAVVGKAHRLELDARPYPIKRAGAAKTPKPERAPILTLPSLASDPIPEPSPVAPAVRVSAAPFTLSAPPAPIPAPRIEPPSPIPYQAPVVVSVAPTQPLARVARTCLWPIGHPGTKDFRFCDEAIETRIYCDAHARQAFIRVRTRAGDERIGT